MPEKVSKAGVKWKDAEKFGVAYKEPVGVTDKFHQREQARIERASRKKKGGTKAKASTGAKKKTGAKSGAKKKTGTKKKASTKKSK